MTEDFATPVELSGVDTTRVRNGRAQQALTLGPDGITLVRDGTTVSVAWRDITGIDLVQVMTGRLSALAKAWAISGAAEPIYPYEFDEQWTTGPIGRWLTHYRPDLDLPADGATLPLGIPQRMYPWVFAPAALIGIVVLMVGGMSLSSAALWTVACVGGILLLVSSPRKTKIFGNVAATIGFGCMLLAGIAWLIGEFGLPF
ncbi:hypothetical protein [Mycolicibacterium brisbanense]|uniref:Transmembrane protein n=1 Tax=Mycolicibacterium brisbanense TaxID=146020 RepID=A0A100W1R6_9MYCO|nr:hypothetical protein [Mycolicibacterium brisbanense]MCV7159825.1 hypothetical protein [Mycolicibacterium brisbanense]GAS90001.1 uncharacterized protein RMCB_4097 [Mycolicibacterium brisbanense]